MIYLIFVSILWAFSFGLIGSALAGLDSFFVAALRLVCASCVFLFFLKPSAIGKGSRIRLFLYGAIQFGLMYSCYMKAYHYIPSHLVALFSVFTPIYVVLIHEIRNKEFFLKYIVAAFLSVLGATFIKAQGKPSGDILIGFGLMQIAGVSFAFGQVAYRNWKRSHPAIPDRSTFAWLSLGGLFFCGLFASYMTDRAKVTINTEQAIAIVYLGIFASGLGFFLWNKGASQTNPGTLAAFNNMVVPLAVIVSLFVFGEIKDLQTESLIRLLVGTLFIGMGIFVAQRKTVTPSSEE